MALFKRHWLAVVCAVAVGVMYIAPHIAFIASLGAEYKRIPIMNTPNEDFYLARVQEILDGHPTIGSAAFYEYKDQMPLSPPTVEFIYALPTLLFGISPTATLLASRFLLPAVLFLLVYFLVRRLIEGDESIAGTVTALGGAFLITLGYDLVDYRSIWNFFVHHAPLSTGFLIWSRPINPIFGALFLFSFLLCIVSLVQRRERIAWRILGASSLLALMMASYFFSWGIALSVLVVLVALLLLRREYQTAGTLALIVPFGVLLSAPYWIGTWRAAQSPWYEASVLRSGLFLTHYPLLNKFLLATFAFFFLLLLIDFVKKRKNGIVFQWERWHLFSLSFLLGGLLVYSQQVLTGRTVWPYHFVQYTIPLAMVVVMTTLFYMRKNIGYLWHASIGCAVLASLLYSITVQTTVYQNSSPYYKELQSRAPLFDWLNKKERDCVVLVVEPRPSGRYGLEGLIPAFTHCNTYNSTWVYSLMPDERIAFNYLVHLFFQGVTPLTRDAYLKSYPQEPQGRLFSNWKGLYGVSDFPDFSDHLLAERTQQIPPAYQKFFAQDIKRELKQYRLDYIVSEGPLTPALFAKLGNPPVVYQDPIFSVYSF